MTIRMRAMVVAASAVGAAMVLSAPERVSAATCLSNWAEAAQVVTREKLVTVEALTALTRNLLAGDLVRTSLCEENGRYVYKIVVREPGGSLRNLAVDARKPFAR